MSDIGDRKWRAWLYMLPNGGGWAGLALRCCSEGRCNVIKPDDYPAGYRPGDIAERAMHQALGGR